MNKEQLFSVCMSVYKNDNPADFSEAVFSIYNQTCPPDEIVLVVDGPVPAVMHDTINALKDWLENNNTDMSFQTFCTNNC